MTNAVILAGEEYPMLNAVSTAGERRSVERRETVPKLRTVVSSADDLNAERVFSGRAIHRLESEYERRAVRAQVFWEHKPSTQGVHAG